MRGNAAGRGYYLSRILLFTRRSTLVLLGTGFFLFPPAAAGAQGPLTLDDCCRLALKNSISLSLKRQALDESKGNYLSALGTILPRVSFTATVLKQNVVPGTRLPAYFATDVSAENSLSLSQPIFSGFREYAALAASKADQKARIADETRTRQLLLSDVAAAFLAAVEQHETAALLGAVNALLQERVNDLRERVKVGRSRRSDLVSTLVLLYQNEADTELARSQERDLLAYLAYIIGASQPLQLSDETALPGTAGDEDSFLSSALRRPDMESARQTVIAAQKQVAIARAGYLPSINLSGNYYFKHTGRYEGIDWDLSLTGQMPLLPYFGTKGAVEAAAARAREAELLFENTRLAITRDVTTAYNDLSSALSRAASQKRALDAAEETYTLELEDYRLHLVSNLDLLQVIQALQNARLGHLHAQYAAKRAWWRLKVAAGEIP